MKFSSSTLSLTELEEQIQSFSANPLMPQDAFAAIAVAEAIGAAKEGNIGVGGCIVKSDKVIIQDHNRQFVPYFRGDLHAEMVIANQLEDMLKHEAAPDMRAYSFFSSQEPCPMCMLRLISSGIGNIYYVYRDANSPDQGKIESIDRLPPIWGELAKRQHIAEADCSIELKKIAHHAFLLTASDAAEKIKSR